MMYPLGTLPPSTFLFLFASALLLRSSCRCFHHSLLFLFISSDLAFDRWSQRLCSPHWIGSRRPQYVGVVGYAQSDGHLCLIELQGSNREGLNQPPLHHRNPRGTSDQHCGVW